MQAHAQGNHDGNPHKKSRAKACEVAYPEMSQDGNDEVDGQTDTGDYAQQGPKNS